MCGICGGIGLADDSAKTMVAALAHRGPDDEGIFTDAERGVILGHRRLSIIDLSSAGRQPLIDSTGRYVIVYNGELYNYRDLRRRLIKLGYRFQTDTDTEVVLVAFKEWGPRSVERFRGMFAFAIYDRGARHGPPPRDWQPPVDRPYLFLARDRFGIKPLLCAHTSTGFAFGSEIKALRATDLVNGIMDETGLADYLRTGSIYQPRTVLRDVHHLPAGTWRIVDTDGQTLNSSCYWDIREDSAALRKEWLGRSFADAVTETRKRLEDATRAHLVSDVEVGAFLSGGIDSSTVVALMQRHADRPVKTFSVGFAGTADVPDERAWARETAEFLGCDHSEVVMDGHDVAEAFDALLDGLDQPSIDGTNTFFVSRAATRSVKVAISGLGGDELLVGYPHMAEIAITGPRSGGFPNRLAALLHEYRPNRITRAGFRRFVSPARRLQDVRMTMWKRRIAGTVRKSVFRAIEPGLSSEPLSGFFPEDLDGETAVSYAECQGYLRSTLLRDGDATSMANSLEVRPVLLDHHLAEFLFALPGRIKRFKGLAKAPLVDAVRDLLPESCFTRPKLGFELPVTDWMNGPLNDRFRDCLHTETARLLFRPAAHRVLAKRAKNRTLKRQDWMWLVLCGWSERTKTALPTA